MQKEDVKIMTRQILELLEKRDLKTLKKELNELSLHELINLFQSLEGIEDKNLIVIFRMLNKELSLDVFENLEPDYQKKMLKAFSDEFAAEIIAELAPDDRAEILDELPAKVAKKLTKSLDAEEREKTSMLLGYPPETAGRIMTPDYISLKEEMTVSEAFERLRKNREEVREKETVYMLYVTDKNRKLNGVLSLRDLVLATEDQKIKDIMEHNVVSVYTRQDQEEVATIIKNNDFIAVPVVDREQRLVGIVTVDDAMDILEEETTEDIFTKAGMGVMRQEQGKSAALVRGSMLTVWKVRIPFLLITLGGGMMAGAVINSFEEALAAVTALAIFIPVIMDMGGNTGTQSSTIFTRGLVLGQINPRRFMRHLLREMGIGFSMGIILGILAGFIAYLWQGIPELGIAVGTSLALTVTIASSLGFLVPFILVKLGLDQAAGADPVITTIKDITGLMIYFYSAILFLGHLL